MKYQQDSNHKVCYDQIPIGRRDGVIADMTSFLEKSGYGPPFYEDKSVVIYTGAGLSVLIAKTVKGKNSSGWLETAIKSEIPLIKDTVRKNFDRIVNEARGKK